MLLGKTLKLPSKHTLTRKQKEKKAKAFFSSLNMMLASLALPGWLLFQNAHKHSSLALKTGKWVFSGKGMYCTSTGDFKWSHDSSHVKFLFVMFMFMMWSDCGEVTNFPFS